MPVEQPRRKRDEGVATRRTNALKHQHHTTHTTHPAIFKDAFGSAKIGKREKLVSQDRNSLPGVYYVTSQSTIPKLYEWKNVRTLIETKKKESFLFKFCFKIFNGFPIQYTHMHTIHYKKAFMILK